MSVVVGVLVVVVVVVVMLVVGRQAQGPRGSRHRGEGIGVGSTSIEQ